MNSSLNMFKESSKHPSYHRSFTAHNLSCTLNPHKPPWKCLSLQGSIRLNSSPNNKSSKSSNMSSLHSINLRIEILKITEIFHYQAFSITNNPNPSNWWIPHFSTQPTIFWQEKDLNSAFWHLKNCWTCQLKDNLWNRVLRQTFLFSVFACFKYALWAIPEKSTVPKLTIYLTLKFDKGSKMFKNYTLLNWPTL